MPSLQAAIDASQAPAGAALFGASTKRMGRDARDAQGRFVAMNKPLAGTLKLIGAFATATGLSIAARGVAGLSREMVTLAGAQEEVESKFQAVFKTEAPRAAEELERIAGNANRSANRLKGFASTIQDTLVPLGFLRKDAADTSLRVVDLAQDLGSFNDVNTADVIRDIQSTLVGNTETTRKYGIVITEASTKQEAYNLGLAKQGEELDAVQKAQARLSIIFKSTTDAQGDLLRTSDSYTNVMRSLEDAIFDVKTELGEGLSEAVLKSIEDLGGVEKVAERLSTALDAVADIGSGFLSFVAPAVSLLDQYDNLIDKLVERRQKSLSLAKGIPVDELPFTRPSGKSPEEIEAESAAFLAKKRRDEVEAARAEMKALDADYRRGFLDDEERFQAEHAAILERNFKQRAKGAQMELQLRGQLANTVEEQAGVLVALNKEYDANLLRMTAAGKISEETRIRLQELNDALTLQQIKQAEAEDFQKRNAVALATSRDAVDSFARSVGAAAVGYGNFGELIDQESRRIIANLIATATQASLLGGIGALGGAVSSGASAGSFASGFGTFLSNIGGATAGARGLTSGVTAFARGGFPSGFINGPTLFPLGPGALGLAGEAGREVGFGRSASEGGGGAVFPLKKTATGEVGVAAVGGGGGLSIGVLNVNLPDSAGRNPQAFARSKPQMARVLTQTLGSIRDT